MYEDKLIRRAYLVQTLKDMLTKMHDHEIGITSADLDLINNEITTLKTVEKTIVPAINELWEHGRLHAVIYKTSYGEWQAVKDTPFDETEGAGTKIFVINEAFDAPDEYGNQTHFYPNSLILGTPEDPTASTCAYKWSYVTNPLDLIGTKDDLRDIYGLADKIDMVEMFNLIADFLNNDGTSTKELSELDTDHKTIVPAINEIVKDIRFDLRYNKLSTMAQWEANYKHAMISPLAKPQQPVAYQISEDFTFDGVDYKAGSWIMGEDLVMDPDTAGYLTYDWYVFEQPFLRLGLNKDLTTVEQETIVGAINELDEKQGDEVLTVVDTVDGKTTPETTISASINVLDKEIGDVNTLTVKDAAGDLKKEVTAAINELDLKQGDDVLTVVDTKAGKGDAETEISAAINVLDKELGENIDIDALINKRDTIVDALNSIFLQSVLEIEDVPIDPTDPDYARVEKRYVFKQNYPAGTDPAVPTNILQTIDIEKPKFVKEVTTFRSDGTEIDPQTGEHLIEGHMYMKLVIENQEDPIYLDVNQLIVDFIVEDTDRIDLTLEEREIAGERMRVVTADIIDGSIARIKLDENINKELDFIGYDFTDGAVQLTTEAQTAREGINELNVTKTVSVTEVPEEELNPGVAKAFDINQSLADGTVDKKGTIEIPFSNYEGEDTATIDIDVDNTDGHRVIKADVIDASIGKQQLDAEVNDILDYVGDKTIKLSDKDTLTEAVNDNIIALTTKMSYKATVSYLDFVASYLNTAAKNDVYVISTDFVVDGTNYNAGSWALCTESPEVGAKTWRYINNGGDGTVIKPITNENEISEVRDAEGNIIVTDVIGSANVNDPAGSIYMISTAGIVKFAPHHGIYVKTAEAGGTEVVEIFDFGKDGASKYEGSEGANIKVTVDVVGTTGTIGATIVLGSLNKALMDEEINNIFDFTGYPTALTTAAQDLAGGINEHDAELGDIVNAALEIKDGTNNDVATILKAIAKNNLTWEGAIDATTATTTIVATTPLKRGYVYNVTGVDSTINGVACTAGDWLVVVNDAAIGVQPQYMKLGSSSGAGLDDGGPLKILL